MVKSAEKRTRKYEESVSGERVGRAVSDLKPLMVEQQKTYFPKIAMLEAKVKSLCEAQGVSTLQVRDYLNVARKCYSINRKFSQATRDAEAQRIVTLWTNRGLNAAIASEVCNLTGCRTTAAPITLETPLPIHHEVVTERWYPSTLVTCFDQTAFGQGVGRVTLMPFPIARRTRISRIGLFLDTGALDGRCRLGLYETDGHAAPTNLLTEGETDATPAQNDSTIYINVDVTLPAGLYYVAATFNDSVRVRRWGTAAHSWFITVIGTETLNYYDGGIETDIVYGPLPNPFPPRPQWTFLDTTLAFGIFIEEQY